MSKKRKPKPVSQNDVLRYCRMKLGYAGEAYTSPFTLACRALSAEGRPAPAGVTSKEWVYRNAAHINESVKDAPPIRRVKKSRTARASAYVRPVVSIVPKAAKWVAAASVVTQPMGVDVRSDDFLRTFEWRRLRMQALKLHGPQCQCCGATPATGAVMNVDHIKPRRLFPDLAMSLDNLQILCDVCNHGKGNWDMTDWRGGMDDGELDPEQKAHLAAI
jgi:5-methylcytosine-specific restriction endonuclease McrA